MRWEERVAELPTGPLDCGPTPSFESGDPQMVAYLREHGYAVVRGVADAAQVEAAKSKAWGAGVFSWPLESADLWIISTRQPSGRSQEV